MFCISSNLFKEEKAGNEMETREKENEKLVRIAKTNKKSYKTENEKKLMKKTMETKKQFLAFPIVFFTSAMIFGAFVFCDSF